MKFAYKLINRQHLHD